MKVRMPSSSPALADLVGLDSLENMFGPVGPDVRRRLLRVLKNPTNAAWHDAHSIILRTGKGLGLGLTLWQAWIRLDPTAPKIGPASPGKWARIPTQEELFWILRYAATLTTEEVICRR